MLSWLIKIPKELWLLFLGALGALALYRKGKTDKAKEIETEELQEDLETVKRIQNVEINTDRDAALERLRKSGHVRKD